MRDTLQEQADARLARELDTQMNGDRLRPAAPAQVAAQVARDRELAAAMEIELNGVRSPLTCPARARLPPYWLQQT